ncbi:hypothetical protein INS49_006511 [Diaporthe citri]|uniref:uncharacterized protein n=1 Tax=Diaporthe citri TaxID=83186 RepID=UPI001C7F64C2|nr:uncharacterized protein INS49_006511 [Diaporthe citri]KAG6364907.1 hypothetical protein INS49_006511 [Diaporthe citri]
MRYGKVLDAEVRNLSITLQDADIWLHTASSRQKETAATVLGECRTLLHQLQQVLDKFTELRPHRHAGGRQEMRYKLKRLWSSIRWDPEEINGFQLRIISNITKLNTIGQEKMQVFSALKSISASVDRVNVLIDALDELDGQIRNDLVATMLRLQKEIGLSLFLTSRHNVGIEEKIHPGPALTVEIRASSEDVQKYLRANLSRLPRCVSGKYNLQKTIVASITTAVDGMFLLAELHMNSLKNKTSAKEIHVAISQLSSGSNAYNDAYKAAWNRINAQPEEHRNLARQTISIILTARRPLSVGELCHALSVDIEDGQIDDEEDMRNIEDILSTCAGLVTADPGSNKVRLVHKSTQDYFYRNRAEFFPDAEDFVVRICVIYRRAKNSESQNAPFYDYSDKNWKLLLSRGAKPNLLGKNQRPIIFSAIDVDSSAIVQASCRSQFFAIELRWWKHSFGAPR